jgi:predicted nucleic acid-binding OB-fold protein
MVTGRRSYESSRVCLRVFRRSLNIVEVEVEVDVRVDVGDEVPVRSGSSSSISMYFSMVVSTALAWIPSSSAVRSSSR